MEWCRHDTTLLLLMTLQKEMMSQEVHWGLTHQWLCRRLSSPRQWKSNAVDTGIL